MGHSNSDEVHFVSSVLAESDDVLGNWEGKMKLRPRGLKQLAQGHKASGRIRECS